jgi:chromosome segregation ATPase
MSSPPDPVALDLDRTDELPRLDVEAYEASLADSEKGLTRTDTWNVAALQEIDELAQDETGAMGQGTASPTLTGNVDSILKRIADLEADVVAAHEANEALQKHSEGLQTERDRLAALAQTLESENARQREHRELAQTMAERVESQLREELAQTKTHADDLQALLMREREQALSERSALQAKLADQTSENARLLEDHRAKEAELAAATELVQERAKAIAVLEQNLHQQRELTDQVARQLAAKLAECDRLDLLVDKRDLTIDELIAARNALDEEFRASRARIQEVEQALDQTRSAAAAHEQRTLELSSALEDAQRTIQSLQEQVERAREHVGALTDERDSLLPLKTLLAEETEALERKEAELEQVWAELQNKGAALDEALALAQRRTEEIDTLRAKLRDQTQAVRGLEQTLATRDELVEQLNAQLASAEDAHAALSVKFDKVRRRVKVLTQELFRRDHRISELRTELTVHTEALAAIRRDVNRIGHDTRAAEQGSDIERVLEPVDHDGPEIALNGKMLTVGRTSESDVCVPSKLVSRNHARLLVGPTGVIIEDAGSTNGCYVNGKQVRKHLMHDGDLLELGDLRYRLRSRSALSDTKVRANVVSIFEPRTP